MFVQNLDPNIENQFKQFKIKLKPNKKYSLKDLENINKNLNKQDLEDFKNILNFRCYKKNEHSSEYALAWLLECDHIGGAQNKVDLILPNNEGISVKCYTRNKNVVKLGRVASSDSYKELLSLWYFYKNYCVDDKELNKNSITKKDIQKISVATCREIQQFLDLQKNKIQDNQNLKYFLNKTSKDLGFLKEEIILLINKTYQDVISKNKNLTHILHLEKKTLNTKISYNVNKKTYIENFYFKSFLYITGDELWIKMN